MNLSSLTTSNRLVYILVGSIGLLLFLTVILVFRSFGGSSSQPATLQFWGVFDDRQSLDAVIQQFQKKYPNIRIAYRNFLYDDYEKSVVDALAAGNGPDVWMIHHTWLPKHKDKLLPLPDKIAGEKNPLMTIKQFRDEFVDVAFNDLVDNGKIYSLPIYVDTLALYYNKDLFNNAGITSPPTTWDEFNSLVEKLTKFDAARNITQSGAAIGSARNINRSTDILSALMLQSGVQMTEKDNASATFTRSVDNQRVGEVSLQYYTDFTNPAKLVYCWNDSQHYSIDSFAEGSTAMMFNYSHQIQALRQKSQHLNFAVAPMPQLSSSDIKTYASYWAPAVAASTKYPDASWQFVAYMASNEGATAYLNQTSRPAARRDLIETQRNDPDIGVFAVQALSAVSWYQVDNVAVEQIFADMIDDVNLGRATIKDALESAEAKVNVLMSRKQ
ncbi:MAG TPA: extracellular solute-binding protein [Candidatus Paceibacterota bacterium]|nr:extracellular solute-binding protein [Candidatus Paceibacterota bacterium]